MGITNIRSSNDMLSRCNKGNRTTLGGWSNDAIPCVIPDFGAGFILDVAFSTERDLLKWGQILRLGLDDQWIQHGKQAVTTAPSGMRYPKIQLCPMLYNYLTEDHPELATFVIVQGKEGAALAKLVLKDRVDQLGAQIFMEACNGFSVVFSGIIRKEDAKSLGQDGIVFKMIKTIDELLDVGQDGSIRLAEEGSDIPIFC